MISTRELFRPLLVYRKQEKRKRVSLEIGQGIKELVESGIITYGEGLKVMEGTRRYADPYQVHIGWRRDQTLHTVEIQKLTNHSRRRPH